MSAKVISIEKSKTFGQDVNGQKRYIAVITMCKTTEGGSKFACGAFGTNNTYKLSLDLVAVYGDDENCKNDEGNFSAKKAFETLQKEYTPEGVGLYDIDLGGTYIVKETKREMTTARIAIYGTEEDAKKYAMRSLARDLDAKRIFKKEDDKKEEKNEEEE